MKVLNLLAPLAQQWKSLDPWLMVSYHGDWGWAFPNHPHYGIETITYPLDGTVGYVDHADSIGNTGRYAAGDVQFMTAGKGISHSEVSVHTKDETVEHVRYSPSGNRKTGNLFQVWLNQQDKKKKSAKPHAKMFWNSEIPIKTITDANSKQVMIKVLIGNFDGISGLVPPPDSYSTDKENFVTMYHIAMESKAEFNFVRANAELSHTCIYYFGGSKQGSIILNDSKEAIPYGHMGSMTLNPELATVKLTNNSDEYAELFVLEGKPIGENVVWHGPMVTTSEKDMRTAFMAYQSGKFGSWPHSSDGPVMTGKDRFARFAGKTDTPKDSSCVAWPANPRLRLP